MNCPHENIVIRHVTIDYYEYDHYMVCANCLTFWKWISKKVMFIKQKGLYDK